MPGVSIIGQRRVVARPEQLRPTALSAGGRTLARFLKLLPNPATSHAALQDALQQQGVVFKKKPFNGGLTHQQYCLELARDVEVALETLEDTKFSSAGRPTRSGKQSTKTKDDDQLVDNSSYYSNDSQPPTTTNWISPQQTHQVEEDTRATIVSESEGVSTDEETTTTAAVTNVRTATELWPLLLESVHLQVASRTTQTWGKKKTYEVYRLAGPTTPVSNLKQLEKQLANTFLNSYDGKIGKPKVVARNKDCRVYCVHQNNADEHKNSTKTLWIQINIGSPLDVQDESNRAVNGQKKKKADKEFTIMLEGESNLVALTASRAASRSVFTPYILSALETVLTCSVDGGYASHDFMSQRVHDLSGTCPHDLIQTAKAIEEQDAVGRYSRYAAKGAATNPITDLQHAAGGSLLSRPNSQTNLPSTAKAEVVSKDSTGNMVVQHDSKKRNRDDQEAFVDCPKRQSLRWDWKGRTAAPAAVWGTESDNDNVFKCRLELNGTDVFGGMQAMIDAGILEGPLPHYVKDAPMMGGKIAVEFGAIVQQK